MSCPIARTEIGRPSRRNRAFLQVLSGCPLSPHTATVELRRLVSMQTRRAFLVAALSVAVSLPLAADWPNTERVDLDAVYRIKEEGLQRSTGTARVRTA